MEEFWESSSKIAQITAWLAPKVKVVNHDDAYTFSLFRDCGTAALLASHGDYKPAGFAASTDPEQMLAAEKTQFGMDHTILGYQMAKNWLLPDTTCDAVLHHHNYDQLVSGEIDIPNASIRLIALALASEWIYTMHTAGTPCQGWDKAGKFALKNLKATESQLESYVDEVESVLQ